MSKDLNKFIKIDWCPSKDLKQSLPSQIVDYFLNKISSGEWLVGDRLPSQRELSRLFGVNRSTIVEAISELTSLQILGTNYGNGTKIINNTWSLLVSSAPPNWKNYINTGAHSCNLPTIQTINTYEFLPNIIRISTGELGSELLPNNYISEALQNVSMKNMNYLEPLGLLPLRKSLAHWYQKKGLEINPSNILIVSGSLQALHLISIGILSVNSTVFVERFSYIKSLRVLQSAKVNVVEVPMDNEGLIPSMIRSEKKQGKTTMLYTIPTFHNPTGITMSKKRRIALLEWCSLNQLPIIEDNAYSDLWFDEVPPPSLKSLDANGTVLYLDTLSKTFCPGFRIGWLIGPEPVVSHLGDIKMQVDYGANSIAQWAINDLISSGAYDIHLENLRTKLRNRRDHMLSLLEKYFSGLATWKIPNGGFYIWLKLQKNISTTKIFDMAIKENILINPGSVYDGSENSFIRLSYSYCTFEEMDYALSKLSKIIKTF